MGALTGVQCAPLTAILRIIKSVGLVLSLSFSVSLSTLPSLSTTTCFPWGAREGKADDKECNGGNGNVGENVEKVVKEIGKSVLAFLEIKNIEGRHRHEKMSRAWEI